jgi:ABC-2 type transport system ATP-binding protein
MVYGLPDLSRTDSGAAIWTEGLTRHFGQLTAVDSLSLQVDAGEVFGFLGHNGAGKTTTVRLLNGVIQPHGGAARVLGFDPLTQGPELRRHTGVLTETPSVDERLTGRENLLTYAHLYGVPRKTVADRVAGLLELFGLSERASEKAGAYSKGMKHRLALARALLHEPEVLFLDEPTAGLDPVAARQVHELIADLRNERRTVFICTHNLAEAQRLCDRVAVLEQGQVVAMGTPAELARDVGGRQRLEIELAPEGLPAALAALNLIPDLALDDPDSPTIGERGPRGVRLTMATASHDAIPDVIDTLVKAGVRIYRVSPQEVSLEDVYFALHEQRTPRPAERSAA